ncbi:hypothetical protein FRB97_003488 [Tulasnella sp. 331]|nr:hypothetical protein FRB97_003488 [Tulasnella sp. 331]
MARPLQAAHAIVRRQDVTFDTASSIAIAVTAPPTGAVLSIDNTATDVTTPTAPVPLTSITPTFQGIGGTLTANTLIITTTIPTPTIAPTSSQTSSASLTATPTKSISTTTLIAVFVTVPMVCLLLIGSVYWKRKRDWKRHDDARRNRRITRQRQMSHYTGSDGFARMEDASFEDLKHTYQLPSHVPGSLPSPASPKNNLQFSEKAIVEHHILSNFSAHPQPPSSSGHGGPRRKSKRFSMKTVKSTFTGRINPSNNFASASHDDSHDHDDGAGDDTRSTRSRQLLSQTSPLASLSTMPSSFSGLGAALHSSNNISPADGFQAQVGEPSSFLTFKSDGETADIPQLRATSPSFPFPVKAGPAAQSTPTPKRTMTQRSLKGGGASQSGHGHADAMSDSAPPIPKGQAALGDLIAALDHPQEEQTILAYASNDNLLPSPQSSRAYTSTMPS